MSTPRAAKIKSLIDGNTSDLHARPIKWASNPSGHHVILTGSTGYLGSYILASLLACAGVRKIYCLNRSSNGEDAQTRSFQEKGLPMPSDTEMHCDSKLKYIHVDLEKPNLGLDGGIYSYLASHVDSIIHNAWPINFAAPLDAFTPYIRSVRSLVDFSTVARYHPQIFFISTAVSAFHWPEKSPMRSAVPECLVDDDELPLEQGYAESKYVSDRILKAASARLGIRCTTIRTGQLAGPIGEHGEWKREDFWPSLISTSVKMGEVPLMEAEMDMIDWVPVDVAGKVVAELFLHQNHIETEAYTVFNLVNPRVSSWSLVASAVQGLYELRAVPLKSWVSNLANLAAANEDYKEYPALHFLKLFEQGASMHRLSLDTEHAQEASPALRSLSAVNETMVHTWLSQWAFYPELMCY